jgi:hypothetical protein
MEDAMNRIPGNLKMSLVALFVLAMAQPALAAKVQAPSVKIPKLEAFLVDEEGAVLVPDAASNSVYRVAPGAEPEVLIAPSAGLYRPDTLGFDGQNLFIGDERGVFVVVNDPNARTSTVQLSKVLSFVKAGPKLPYVKITAPALLSCYEMNKTIAIHWAHNLGKTARFNVELSRDGGETWEVLATDIKGTTYTWKTTLPETASARLRVSEVEALTPENRSSVADMTDDVLYLFYPAE